MHRLELSTETRRDASILRLAGEAGLATIAELDRAVAGCVESGAGPLVADLSDVEFIDSTVTALFLRARRRLAEQGRRMILVAREPHVRRVLELSGPGRTLPVVGSLGELPA